MLSRAPGRGRQGRASRRPLENQRAVGLRPAGVSPHRGFIPTLKGVLLTAPRNLGLTPPGYNLPPHSRLPTGLLPPLLSDLIATTEARPPRMIDDTIPKELERICQKALSKRASERYNTARDMAEDLREFLETAGGMISPATPAVPPAIPPSSTQEKTPAPSTSTQSDVDRRSPRGCWAGSSSTYRDRDVIGTTDLRFDVRDRRVDRAFRPRNAGDRRVKSRVDGQVRTGLRAAAKEDDSRDGGQHAG